MSKVGVFLSATTDKIRVNGSGELYRLSIPLRVHAGLATMVDRQCTLVMDQAEAVDFAVGILSHVSIDFLTVNQTLAKLKRVLEVAEA